MPELMSVNHNTVWKNCLNLIQENISEQGFKTWFKPIVPIRFEDQVLTIQVPNQYIYEMLEDQFIGILKKAIKSTIGPEGKLEYEIPVNKMPEASNTSSAETVGLQDMDSARIKNPFVIPGIKKAAFDSELNPKFIFDNLIEGECNKMARSAGLAIAERPGITSFNPLFLYGGTGLGKTHLAHAIGNKIVEKFPSKRVKYISCEKLTNQVVYAFKTGTISDLSLLYNSFDVLIVDDIQFLSEKPRTQETFFFIFNELHQNQKQIVITSDRPPKDMEKMEKRLISRFKWGLTAEMELPDYETRIAIAESKIEAEGFKVPEDVLEFICYNMQSNVRELEGMLISLAFASSLNNREINIQLAKEIINKFVDQLSKEVTIENIQSLVAEYFKMPIEKLSGASRKRSIVIARQLSMYLAKNFTNKSLKTIGENFGGKDHTTVIYSCKAVQDMIDTDPEFKGTVEELERKVRTSLAVSH
ncbi:MAG TPA: chromosomal replication initiator protein DnaA [Saprospiraceae bacterium]|nr:chromosomal replication initiator protein DnaA [Saprospiraceae bacterium]HMZ24482.1 chromosomal replication initiator protein DnaA [Saprospiraceae bacterium]HNA75939.1 chromosomal replication initiator protein DnaA [Saprospiraceae bacterium]HND73016.1 chromosomal replication initiator protein DnaA [Saprospiraceae bacterium]HNF20589.1 chromosomal replication initiator protein DnaA [Saprospiraceae bacterium]